MRTRHRSLLPDGTHAPMGWMHAPIGRGRMSKVHRRVNAGHRRMALARVRVGLVRRHASPGARRGPRPAMAVRGGAF